MHSFLLHIYLINVNDIVYISFLFFSLHPVVCKLYCSVNASATWGPSSHLSYPSAPGWALTAPLFTLYQLWRLVSPLRANLQAVNFQICECASGSSKEPDPGPSASGVSETAACPVSCCWWSFSSISHLLSILRSETLLTYSLNASPCIPAAVLNYCTFQGTIL